MAKIAESYSGYLTVNKPQCNSNLFFWFFPAKAVDPEKAPVLLWLQVMKMQVHFLTVP